MSNDIDFTTERDDDTDLVKSLRAQLKNVSGENKVLRTENTTFKTQVRQSSVADVLKSKGVNPKVAALIPPDVDPTEDGITTWLKDYGDVFGVQVDDAPKGADQAQVAALAQAQRTGQEGTSVLGTVASAEATWQQGADNARTMEELTAYINSHPPTR